MKYPAALFDLDGTLLDTLDDLSDSVNQVLHESGWPRHTRDEYRFFIGEGVEKLVERAAPPEFREPRLLAEKTARARAIYLKNSFNKTKPYPGIPELLAALAEKGAALGILSNKPHSATLMVVSYYFPEVKWRTVAGAKPEVPKKPDPAGALLAARALEVHPSHVAYLGDTATDMKTATAAGMLPLGAGWGFRPAEELSGHGATAVLGHPLEMLDRMA